MSLGAQPAARTAFRTLPLYHAVPVLTSNHRSTEITDFSETKNQRHVSNLQPRCFSAIMHNFIFLSPNKAKAGFDTRPGQDNLVVSRKSRPALVRGMELIPHPHLNPSLRMSRAIPPLNLYPSMALTEVPLLITSVRSTVLVCAGAADTLDYLLSPLLYSQKNHETCLSECHVTTLSNAEITQSQ